MGAWLRQLFKPLANLIVNTFFLIWNDTPQLNTQKTRVSRLGISYLPYMLKYAIDMNREWKPICDIMCYKSMILCAIRYCDSYVRCEIIDCYDFLNMNIICVGWGCWDITCEYWYHMKYWIIGIDICEGKWTQMLYGGSL